MVIVFVYHRVVEPQGENPPSPQEGPSDSDEETSEEEDGSMQFSDEDTPSEDGETLELDEGGSLEDGDRMQWSEDESSSEAQISDEESDMQLSEEEESGELEGSALQGLNTDRYSYTILTAHNDRLSYRCTVGLFMALVRSYCW